MNIFIYHLIVLIYKFKYINTITFHRFNFINFLIDLQITSFQLKFF